MMNGRNKKKSTDIRKIDDILVTYRSNIADIIGTDILTDILNHYLGWGPISDISLIYR
ncbi:hypothetical protein Hanom_Chr00s000609g01652141 [Helianthus anomalus]